MTSATKTTLSKMERVRRALEMRDVDRTPYSFWTHFPGDDLFPEKLVPKTVDFAHELDLDFVKAMSNGLFCVEDWGVVADYSDVAKGGVAHVVSTPIHEPEDWKKIKRLSPDAPALARELSHISNLVAAMGPETPVLATAFSPMTVLYKLAGPALARDLEAVPDLVQQALENVALTMADFAKKTLSVGAAGVFFAAQDADKERTAKDVYQKYATPFDLMALEGAKDAWFNVIHMHGTDVYFDVMSKYPVNALNWHIGSSLPLLKDVADQGLLDKPLVGGLRREKLTACDMDAIKEDIKAAVDATKGRGLLFGPGCVIRHPVDRPFLKQVAEVICNTPVA